MAEFHAECVVCNQPLPLGEPVAFMDKGRLIHVRCYRIPPTAGAGRRDGRGRARRPSRIAGMGGSAAA